MRQPSDPAAAKPYSECHPFTYELYPTTDPRTLQVQERFLQQVQRLLKRKPPPAKGSGARVFQLTLERWREAA